MKPATAPREMLRTQPSALPPPKKHQCPTCPYKARVPSRLGTHMRIHTGEKNLQCRFCHHKFNTKQELERHYESCTCENSLRKHEESHGLTRRVNKRHSCPLCSYKCETMGNVKQHLVSHLEERAFECNKCNHKSKSVGGLRAHLLTHSAERPFKCSDCESVFKTASCLGRHKRTHSSVLIAVYLSCEVDGCSARFRTESSRAGHLKRVHNRETAMQCPYCRRVLASPFCYQEYCRTHTNEKPLKCDRCDYQTGFANALRRHKEAHKSNASPSCTICHGLYKSQQGLKQHLRLSHNTTDKNSVPKVKTLNGEGGQKTMECKPCFVRVVRLKIRTE